MSAPVLVLASRNRGKIAELQTLLTAALGAKIVLKSLDDVGIFGEIEENGTSFAENALEKARAAARSGYIGIGDDSGLAVAALGGAPGIYSARYAGGHGDDAANNALLLKNLEHVTDRAAKFVCALACAFPDGREPLVVTGEVHGTILRAPRGQNGFGYDPLFYVEKFGKTTAELPPDEKNAISHRGAAVRALAPLLSPLLAAYAAKKETLC